MSLNFAVKDITRNRAYSMPFMWTIAIPVSLLVFTLDLSTNTGNLAFSPRRDLFTPGIQAIILQYGGIVLLLLGILAISALLFGIYAWIAHKGRDLATMKAIGTLPAILYSFFLVEILLITIVGYILGLFIGSVGYLGIFLILDSTGFAISFQFEIFWNSIGFGVIFSVAYLAGSQKIRKIVTQRTVTELLAGDVPLHTYAGAKPNLLVKLCYHLGTSVKVAARNILRRSTDFHRTFAVLTVCGTLLLISLLGTASLSTTVNGYTTGSVNENSVAIGSTSVLPFITRLYGQFADPAQKVQSEEVDLTNTAFFFPMNNVGIFSTLAGVQGVDARVCLIEPFQEIPGATGDSSVGQWREGTAVVMGVNSSSMRANSLSMGHFIRANETSNIAVGDAIMTNYVDDYSLEWLKIFNQSWRISGVVADPLYNGMSIYIGINNLWHYLPALNTSFNLLLVQVDPAQFDTTLATLQAVTKSTLGPGFDAVSLRSTMQANQAALNLIYDFFILLDAVILGVACVNIVEYHKGAAVTQAKDLLIMRVLGAKRGFLLKSIYWEVALQIVPALGFAVGLGMLLVHAGISP